MLRENKAKGGPKKKKKKRGIKKPRKIRERKGTKKKQRKNKQERMSDLQNSTDDNLVKGFQMKLYRATIFATPIIFGAMLIVLLCLLHIKRRRGMNDRIHRQGLMQLQVFTGTQVNLLTITLSFKTITRFDKPTKIGEVLF